MIATIHYLYARPRAFTGFLRVGHTGHRKLEALLAAGRLRCNRLVFDAAHIRGQGELLKAAAAAGREVILDTNFAEMAAVARFSPAIRKLSWAHPDRVWDASDFDRARHQNTAKALADFAITHGVHAILAPTNFIQDVTDPWIVQDARLCELLRVELDRCGGSKIAIDYPIITTSALLRDAHSREALTAELKLLPVDNVWLRISGFGADATGPGTRHYIEAVRELHHIERPLVADNVGGFSGLAAGAFGAVGGISHGIGQKESFRSSDWKKAPGPKGGGTKIRVYVAELDRHLTEEQLDILFAVKNGRSRFACNETSCCPNGREDMVENAHAHFVAQRFQQIENLAQVPESNRAEYFLTQLDTAVRSARIGATLKIADEGVAKVVSHAKARLVRVRDALRALQAHDNEVSWCNVPNFRGMQKINPSQA